MTLYAACESVIGQDDLGACPCSLDDLLFGLSGAQVTAFVEEICDAAADALARITHLPVGRCEITYRPCRDRCHYDSCPCGCAPAGIPLPGLAPVVTEVKIDGAVVNPAEYAVIHDPTTGARSLERINLDLTRGSWPSTQRVYLPDTQDNTFSITVESGTYPDPILRNAVSEIACEILEALTHERKVDEGAVSMTGYGLTLSYFRFGDPTSQATLNLVGLSWVRRWVAAQGAVNVGAVTSNDLRRGWKLLEWVSSTSA